MVEANVSRFIGPAAIPGTSSHVVSIVIPISKGGQALKFGNITTTRMRIGGARRNHSGSML